MNNEPSGQPPHQEHPDQYVSGSQLEDRAAHAEATQEAKRHRLIKWGIIGGSIAIVVGLAVLIWWQWQLNVDLKNNQSDTQAAIQQAEETQKKSAAQTTPTTKPNYSEMVLFSGGGTRYILDYFPDVRPESYCQQNPGAKCATNIRSKDGKAAAKIDIYDSKQTQLDSYVKKDCKDAGFSAEHDGKPVKICMEGQTGMVLYYAFRITMGGREHLGILTSGFDKGVAFSDMTTYANDLKHIIASIRLQE